jgi:uncharacterized protein (DUF2237 family)
MRYEYVVAEKEIVPDLTDALRNCETCSKWCPPYVCYSSYPFLALSSTCVPSPLSICHPDKKRSGAIVANPSSTWAVCNHRLLLSLPAAMAGRVVLARVHTNRLSRDTTCDTRHYPQQNRNPTLPQRVAAVGRVRTAHSRRKRRVSRSVTSRCGRSDILGPYFPLHRSSPSVISYLRDHWSVDCILSPKIPSVSCPLRWLPCS